MIILIILIVLTGLGIILLSRDNEDGIIVGFISTLVFGIYLLCHILAWSTASYDYNQFITKRNSFEQTLNNARQNNNSYEIASITKEISDWNVKLATEQYKNKLFLFKDYIDDRIDLLEPIK